MKNVIILFLLSLYSFTVNAQYYLKGELNYWEIHEPYKEYSYIFHLDIAVGIQTRASEVGYVTWNVVNGKIKDENGNYTLTTITKLANDYPHPNANVSNICVMWDGKEEGKIEFYMPLNYYIYGYEEIRPFVYTIPINPFNGNVENVNINNERSYQAQDIYVENVNIKSGANVILNGSNSVRIVPGFTAELGSVVRIYNGNTSIISQTKADFSNRNMADNQMQIEKKSALLSQNSPNPVSEHTTINCYIPENSGSACLQFYNMMGVLVLKIPITSIGQNSIDANTTELTNGVYMYSLIVDDCLIDTKRMVVAN